MIIDKIITRVPVGNTSIQRIMHGGGILWHKLYKWKVYEVDKTNIYRYRLEMDRYNGGNHPFQTLTIFENIDINSMTGVIYGTGKSNFIYGSNPGQYFGYIIEDNIGYYVNCFNGACEKSQIYRSVKYIYETKKSRGVYIKEISSSNENEYPENGIKGDYWYEFVE